MKKEKDVDFLDLNRIQFSPEMNLLLSCCIKTINEKQISNIRKIIHEGINWNQFFHLANYHQVLPIVYNNLQKYATDTIPIHNYDWLKSRIKGQKIHTLKLTVELVRIVKEFQKHGIRLICLKGPALALQLYGDIALRQIMDIDLYVDIQDIKKTHHLLSQQGYKTGHPELFSSSLHWHVFLKSKHHIPYRHKEKSLILEIHFRLFKNIHVFPNRELKAWDNPQAIVYKDVKLNTLSLMDNILYLFVHGSIHKWHLLKWLTDLARFCQSDLFDWEKLLKRATEIDLQRPVLQGMLLLNQLFALPLPKNFHQSPINKPIRKMFNHSLTVIDESRETAKFGLFFAFRERLYLLNLKKRMRYKLRYLRDLFYLDSHRRILRLPWFLFPLYFILNPFLWFYKNYIAMKQKKTAKENM